MNQSIQNGLNDLFDQIIPISGDFNKKTYADSFKNAYEKYKPLFTEIAQECENSERLLLFCRIECGKYWIRKVQKEKKKMYL